MEAATTSLGEQVEAELLTKGHTGGMNRFFKIKITFCAGGDVGCRSCG